MPEEKIKEKQKGISIYLSMMIIMVLLSIALGMSIIIVSQIQMIRGIKDSIVALSAADSGAEEIMYQDKVCRSRQLPCDSVEFPCINTTTCAEGIAEQSTPKTFFIVDTDGKTLVTYQAKFNAGATDISSTGVYNGTIRTVEVIRE